VPQLEGIVFLFEEREINWYREALTAALFSFSLFLSTPLICVFPKFPNHRSLSLACLFFFVYREFYYVDARPLLLLRIFNFLPHTQT